MNTIKPYSFEEIEPENFRKKIKVGDTYVIVITAKKSRRMVFGYYTHNTQYKTIVTSGWGVC